METFFWLACDASGSDAFASASDGSQLEQQRLGEQMSHDTRNVVTTPSQSLERFRRSLLSVLELIESESTSLADCKRAACTIRDALRLYESSETFGARLNQQEFDSQETAFAEKLKNLMKAKALTQSDLASRIGCSQPAISQMLRRQCRPQRSTINNLAAALDVEAHELWPNLEVSHILDTVVAVQEDSEMTGTEADAIRRALNMLAPQAPAKPLPSRRP